MPARPDRELMNSAISPQQPYKSIRSCPVYRWHDVGSTHWQSARPSCPTPDDGAVCKQDAIRQKAVALQGRV